MTVEYVFAAYLTAAVCGHGCHYLTPGMIYESRTPRQNPNWCVVNLGIERAAVKLDFKGRPRMLLGPGIVPCPRLPSPPTS
jgi:hypothetical protein